MAKEKKPSNTEKLDELINKLEERLAVFSESELKKLVKDDILKIKQTMDDLQHHYDHLCDVLGFSYQDINYPS